MYLELAGDPITIPGVTRAGEDGDGEPGWCAGLHPAGPGLGLASARAPVPVRPLPHPLCVQTQASPHPAETLHKQTQEAEATVSTSLHPSTPASLFRFHGFFRKNGQ